MKTAWNKGVSIYSPISNSHRAFTERDIEQIQNDARISALKEAAHVVLIATRIPEGARNPTRDFLVIKGEEISNLILSLSNKLKEGTK